MVDRDFTVERPDQLRAADFTYLRCWEGLVLFKFVIDVFSRRVVDRPRQQRPRDRFSASPPRETHGA